MCETKAVVGTISLILLVATSFSVYQAHTENKVGHHSEIESQGPCQKGYKKNRLNGGECYHLGDEHIGFCTCIWLYGGKRCEKSMWWD